MARFPNTEMPGIFNCSDAKGFPNYPKQETDYYLCGYICLLVMMASVHDKLTSCIFSKMKLPSKLVLLALPYNYPRFVRHVLQHLYIFSTVNPMYFLSKRDQTCLNASAMMMMVPGPKVLAESNKTDNSSNRGNQLPFKIVSSRKRKNQQYVSNPNKTGSKNKSEGVVEKEGKTIVEKKETMMIQKLTTKMHLKMILKDIVKKNKTTLMKTNHLIWKWPMKRRRDNLLQQSIEKKNKIIITE